MAFQDLRGILQYVPLFRGKTFVVSIDGGVISDEIFNQLLLDLAVLNSLNVRIVLVHGAKCQIEAMAESRDVTLSNSDGTGPTDEVSLEVSLDAISRLTNDLLRDLNTVGLKAVTANVVSAHPAGVVDGVEYLNTGKIDQIDHDSIEGFLKEGMVPVLSPIGFDRSGPMLRMNSDEVAMETAVAIKADKLIYLSEDFYDLDLDFKKIISSEVLEFVKSKDLESGLECKLHYSARACDLGVSRVHLLDGLEDEVLLTELFSNEGVGLMVHADDYLTVRKAVIGDVPELLLMMSHSMEDGELRKRDKQMLSQEIADFHVLEVDGNMVSCVALHCSDSNKAEVAGLFVKRDHEGRGYGKRMVEHAEKIANEKGATEVFALSTQAYHYFIEKLGYEEDSDYLLPEERESLLKESCRNARILVKKF